MLKDTEEYPNYLEETKKAMGLAEEDIDKHSLKHYWIKRLLRLYVPFVLANMTVGVLLNLTRFYRYTVSQIVLTSLTMRTVYGNRVLWYIMTQCILYFLFYISYKYGGTEIHRWLLLLTGVIIYILLCILREEGSWKYNTVLCFPIEKFI